MSICCTYGKLLLIRSAHEHCVWAAKWGGMTAATLGTELHGLAVLRLAANFYTLVTDGFHTFRAQFAGPGSQPLHLRLVCWQRRA